MLSRLRILKKLWMHWKHIKKMKVKYLAYLLICVIFSLVSCSRNGQTGSGENNGEILERPEIPANYMNLKNPYSEDDKYTISGGNIYEKNCIICHGENGKGDGAAAASLNPKPENLAANQINLSDGYLYWRISEGGAKEPFKSGMPPWKDVLDEEEIWSVINYIRSLTQ